MSMNEHPLSTDDPRLTAFALGELDVEEQAAVATAVAADPALQAAVAEIRATASQLETVFAAEPLPSVNYPPVRAPKKMPAKLLRFPTAYYLVGGMAAAGFAFLVVLRTPELPVHEGIVANKKAPVPETKSYTEISLVSSHEPPARDISVTANGSSSKDATVSVVSSSGALADETLKSAAPVTTFSDAAPAAAVDAGALSAKTDSFVAVAAAEMDQKSTPIDIVEKESLLGKAQDKVAAAEAAKVLWKDSSRMEVSGPLSAAGAVVIPTAPSPVPVGALSFDGSRGGYLAGAGGNVPTITSSGSETVLLSAFTVSESRLNGGVMAIGGGGLRENANTEAYGFQRDNTFMTVANEPLSTFAVDVDTASYSNVRRFLKAGRLPPHDAVRVEELINYFPYRYAAPATTAGVKESTPFGATLEVAAAPWEPKHRLVRIGLKAREVSQAARPAANLVFLLDVSGSMSAPNRLPLVKQSLRLLVGKLRADDRVAIVTYAGQSGLALPSTPVSKAREILEALDELSPGGSTNGAMGIQLAYDIAKANFIPDGVNRVILCTDGDFNVGVTSDGELVRLIEEKAKSNVFLTVLGFGMGNLKDSKLELLADKGNGSYGYIDSQREAEKLLVEQVGGTLVTVAKDVKIQVEFNPAQVSAYRLIGYENRLLKKEDFNNDKIDAGEVGAGHAVTALYEIVPAGVESPALSGTVAVEPLKYQRREVTKPGLAWGATEDAPPPSKELLTVKVRYKKPDGQVSQKVEFPLTDRGTEFQAASNDFKFAAAVAGFGMALRAEPVKSELLASAVRWAEAGIEDDPGGYRAEFLSLAREAQKLAE
jgi:Ca-activated chloride channel family protein